MPGFFSASKVQSKIKTYLVPHCSQCGLHKHCQSPKMPVYGKGRQSILVLGESPGESEDQRNRPFIGKSGQLLCKSLRKFQIDLDEDCWTTNSIICHPKDNRNPTVKELAYCRPNVMQAIQELQPKLILTFGKYAIQSLLEPFFTDSKHFAQVGKWVGWRIPFQPWNTWVCPNWHPSYVVRSLDERDGPVVELLFEQYLESALEKVGCRPWEQVPNYADEIELLFDGREAARILREFITDGGPISFDWETNRIKPDNADAEIVSCAVCWRGKRTIAYPMMGEVVQATRELLVSPCKKIGFNSLFETRWTRAKLGVDVNGWFHDGMLSAHHLDNRSGICSAEYQSLVRFGLTPYDHHIKPYLKSSDKSGVNRIRELDMRSLLEYNAMDSLMEYRIAVSQRKEMKTGIIPDPW